MSKELHAIDNYFKHNPVCGIDIMILLATIAGSRGGPDWGDTCLSNSGICEIWSPIPSPTTALDIPHLYLQNTGVEMGKPIEEQQRRFIFFSMAA